MNAHKNLYPLLIFLLALAVQLSALFYIFDPLVYFFKYWELALRLQGVITPQIEVFYSSPFYIVFLAAGQWTGRNILDLQILQAFLGAFNCWLIYRLGRLCFNCQVGYIAALAAVFYGPFVIYGTSFLPAIWVVTFNLAALICLVPAGSGGKASWIAGAGLFIGLSIISRPNAVIFLLLVIPYLVVNSGAPISLMPGVSRRRNVGGVSNPDPAGQIVGGVSNPDSAKRIVGGVSNPDSARLRIGVGNPSHSGWEIGLIKPSHRVVAGQPIGGKWGTRIRRIFLLLIPVALVVLPVTLFNYANSGEFIPVTASGGWVFYSGNNPRAMGFDFSPPPELEERTIAYYARPGDGKLSYLEHLFSLEIARERTGRDLKHGEGSAFWFQEGLLFIRQHPGRYLRLLGKKLLALANGYEPHDVPEVMERANHARIFPFIAPAILMPIALLGVIIARPRAAGPILYLYLASYLISSLLIYVIPRFRLAVAPVLLIFAAAAVRQLCRRARERRWAVLGRDLLLLLALAILVNIKTPDMRRDREVNRPAFLQEWKGLTAMKQGRWTEAGDAFRKALELNPGSRRARRGLESVKK
ncbi:MAG: glycosyltransferase family 39 protein [PVC group bacterium]